MSKSGYNVTQLRHLYDRWVDSHEGTEQLKESFDRFLIAIMKDDLMQLSLDTSWEEVHRSFDPELSDVVNMKNVMIKSNGKSNPAHVYLL